jgi:deazaflavin-dependent oxidoreductase (nitroreductase family)
MTRLLPALRRGFRLFNRFTVPAIEAGFGPRLSTPVGGSMLVLGTVGHRSGLPRRAPLGYALLDGRLIVVAGYGRATHWFRNALAHPDVEVTLPGAVLSGRAQEITDPVERRRAFRVVVLAEGLVGRLTVGDVAAASDARIDELAAGLPVLAITVTGLRPGPFDPGGRYWRYALAETVLAGVGTVAVWRLGVARGRRSRSRDRA